MRHVSPRLRQGLNAVAVRHVAMSETNQLRKDEPHPMALLSATADFRDRLVEDRILSLEETVQVEVVGCSGHVTSVRQELGEVGRFCGRRDAAARATTRRRSCQSGS